MKTNNTEADQYRNFKHTVVTLLPNPQVFNISISQNSASNKRNNEESKEKANNELKICTGYNGIIINNNSPYIKKPTKYFLLPSIQPNTFAPLKINSGPSKEAYIISKDQQLKQMKLKYRCELFMLFKSAQYTIYLIT